MLSLRKLEKWESKRVAKSAGEGIQVPSSALTPGKSYSIILDLIESVTAVKTFTYFFSLEAFWTMLAKMRQIHVFL